MLIDFLWILEEVKVKELFVDQNGQVLGIKQAIYKAKEKNWLLLGTTQAWTLKKVLGGDSARPLRRAAAGAQLERERQQEEDTTLAKGAKRLQKEEEMAGSTDKAPGKRTQTQGAGWGTPPAKRTMVTKTAQNSGKVSGTDTQSQGSAVPI